MPEDFEKDESPEKEEEETETGSESGAWYIGLDGDDMGSTVEDALVENDTETAETLSAKIKAAFKAITEYVQSTGGEVIFNGGDNVLVKTTHDGPEVAEEMRKIYEQHTNHSATCGVGREPLESHKSLVIGKNTGKNKVVVWGPDQQEVYEQIKAKQDELEKCEEELGEGELAPSLKYRAKAHFERLLSLGYDVKKAAEFIERIYVKGESYREVLKQKRKNKLIGDSPSEVYLRDGEERWKQLVTELESNQERKTSSETDSSSTSTSYSPVIGQKIISKKDLGMINFVGSRFVTVTWLKKGKKERIALSKFRKEVGNSAIVLIPQIRVAKRRQDVEQ